MEPSSQGVPAGQGLSSPWAWGLTSIPDLPTVGQTQPVGFPGKANTLTRSNGWTDGCKALLTQDRPGATSSGCQVGGTRSLCFLWGGGGTLSFSQKAA